LASAPKCHSRLGRQPSWSASPAGINAIRDEFIEFREAAETLRAVAIDRVLRWLLIRIAAATLEAAAARAAQGRLQFHDLLVHARRLLRNSAAARGVLAGRYRRLLLDEFQDTDRIQIEIAVRIAGGEAATAERWQDVAVPDGSSSSSATPSSRSTGSAGPTSPPTCRPSTSSATRSL